jgi:hypothetical protein
MRNNERFNMGFKCLRSRLTHPVRCHPNLNVCMGYRIGMMKKTTNLLINVLSLHPTWMVDPDAALLREQLERRQSGLKSCF